MSPATSERVERQARVIAAHPGWHGVRADRVYFGPVVSEQTARRDLTVALARASARLAYEETLCPAE